MPAFSFGHSPRPGAGCRDADQLSRRPKPSGFTVFGGDRPSSGRFQRQMRRAHLRRAVRKTGAPSWPDRRLLPYLQPVVVMAPATMIGEIAAVTITGIRVNSLLGALVEERSINARADGTRGAPMPAEG